MNKSLAKILERAESWPESAQRELEVLARDIEAEMAEGMYKADASELAGIHRGLRDAADGKFASAEQLQMTFDKFRR